MARVNPVARDIDLLIEEVMSPKEISARFAMAAGELIDEARDANRIALGYLPDLDVYVDGREGAALSSVRPNGTITAVFDVLEGVLEWIGRELVEMSPVLTGTFARSHVLFIDGVERDPAAPLPANFEEAAFLNSQPYARKIERGQSGQAPDGIYEAIAAVAKRRFGNIAQIRYSFRSLTGEHTARQPAIVVRPR